MKALLVLILLVPTCIFGQNLDTVYVRFIYDQDSFPDCNRLYYANGNYRINQQEIVEIELPNTLPIEPTTVLWDDFLNFRSFELEASKYGSIELDDYQIIPYTKEQVMDLLQRSIEDSAYYEWLIGDEDHLREKYSIVHDAKPEPKHTVVEIDGKVETPHGTINMSSGIIDGVFIEDLGYIRIENQNNDHIPYSFHQQSDKIRSEIIQPKLDSLLKPFYFSNYEVTNKEYREFVNWVSDSIELHTAYFNLNHDDASLLLNCSRKERKSLDSTQRLENLQRFGLNPDRRKKIDELNWVIATTELYYPQPQRYYKRREKDSRLLIYQQGDSKQVAIYPDTTGFDELITGSRVVPMWLGNMSWHPAFEDYPVVNLNQRQIMAYCHWKQRQLNKEFNSKGFNITVRPPTITEYEFAAKTSLGPQGYWVANDQSNEKFIPFTRNTGIRDFLFYQRVNYSPFIGRGSSDGIASLNYREWYRANQSFSPIKFLNGNVSEFVIDEVTPEKWEHYQLNADQPKTNAHFVLGTNYVHDVKTRGDDQYNAIFYKTTLKNGTSSPLVGFRLVYLVKKLE